jgi:hypothetical protein
MDPYILISIYREPPLLFLAPSRLSPTDVIYIIPKEIQLEFRSFIQEDVTKKWLKYNKKKSLIVRVLIKLGIELS